MLLSRSHTFLDVDRHARESNARLSFSFIYPDRHGRNVMKEVWRLVLKRVRSGKSVISVVL